MDYAVTANVDYRLSYMWTFFMGSMGTLKTSTGTD